MSKLLDSLVALIYCFASSAYAEHPAAGVYRSYFDSQNFYIEFGDKKNNYVVAGMPNARIAKIASLYYDSNLDYYNGKKDYPDEMYLNGKYYQFENRKKATVALERHLQDERVDYRGNWNKIKNRLSVPTEFMPLCRVDVFRADNMEILVPQFLSSSKSKIGNKEYDADTYSAKLTSHTNEVVSETRYVYYYNGDKLEQIDSFFVKNNRVSQMGSIKIKQITNSVPPQVFEMPKGCKVYAIGLGDMNDLIEQLPVVESY